MAQLHCYVPDKIAQMFKQKAQHAHLSTSKYLAFLVKKEITDEWPEGFFDLFGSWEGDLTRPEQDDYERRIEFE